MRNDKLESSPSPSKLIIPVVGLIAIVTASVILHRWYTPHVPAALTIRSGLIDAQTRQTLEKLLVDNRDNGYSVIVLGDLDIQRLFQSGKIAVDFMSIRQPIPKRKSELDGRVAFRTRSVSDPIGATRGNGDRTGDGFSVFGTIRRYTRLNRVDTDFRLETCFNMGPVLPTESQLNDDMLYRGTLVYSGAIDGKNVVFVSPPSSSGFSNVVIVRVDRVPHAGLP